MSNMAEKVLREALEYYADERYYRGSNQHPKSDERLRDGGYVLDVFSDGGAIARAALASAGVEGPKGCQHRNVKSGEKDGDSGQCLDCGRFYTWHPCGCGSLDPECRIHKPAPAQDREAKVYQRRDDDCFRACVATITGQPYESFDDEPDIKLPTDEWLQEWRKVLQKRGFDIVFFSYKVNDEWQPKGLSIGVGKSPRGKEHAVVCMDGKPYFDPFPNSTGFPESLESFGMLLTMNPAALTPRK